MLFNSEKFNISSYYTVFSFVCNLLCSCLNLWDVYWVHKMLKFESIIQILSLNLENGTDRLSRNVVKSPKNISRVKLPRAKTSRE